MGILIYTLVYLLEKLNIVKIIKIIKCHKPEINRIFSGYKTKFVAITYTLNYFGIKHKLFRDGIQNVEY